jgi:hypothetical protein
LSSLVFPTSIPGIFPEITGIFTGLLPDFVGPALPVPGFYLTGDAGYLTFTGPAMPVTGLLPDRRCRLPDFYRTFG